MFAIADVLDDFVRSVGQFVIVVDPGRLAGDPPQRVDLHAAVAGHRDHDELDAGRCHMVDGGTELWTGLQVLRYDDDQTPRSAPSADQHLRTRHVQSLCQVRPIRRLISAVAEAADQRTYLTGCARNINDIQIYQRYMS